MPFFYFDSYYLILVVPAIILSIFASVWVNSAIRRYSNIKNMRGITGAQAAEEILRQNGISDVRVEMIRAGSGDHFDPRENVIRLSSDVYNGSSVAAVGIAAHEAGHAIQHQEKYVPIQIRSAVFPAVRFGSPLGIILIIIGFAFTSRDVVTSNFLVNIGLLLFSATALFQLVTLPVEFNASKRAMRLLVDSQILHQEELYGVRKVLTAAAMTYVAALIVSVMQLLRLVLLAQRRR